MVFIDFPLSVVHLDTRFSLGISPPSLTVGSSLEPAFRGNSDALLRPPKSALPTLQQRFDDWVITQNYCNRDSLSDSEDSS